MLADILAETLRLMAWARETLAGVGLSPILLAEVALGWAIAGSLVALWRVFSRRGY